MLFNNTNNGLKNIPLDKYQQQAIDTDNANTVIIAPAGAGKTLTLIEAIVDYKKHNPQERICAITYTRAARAEMEDRLRQEGISGVEVTTIHVWSRNILTELSKKYDFKIKILEEPAIKDILKELLNESKARIKPRVEILYSYVSGNKKMDVTDSYLRALDSFNKQYIEYKRTNGLYDFTDYPLYLLDKLNQYDEIITSVDALFVDELQDVDEDQFAIFDKVICNKKFYIGDPKQSIYIFRGADAKAFKKLKNFNFKDLRYNYRSYQEIINYAETMYKNIHSKLHRNNNLISDVIYSEESDIICDRGYGGKVYVMDPFGITNLINEREVYAQEAFNFIWDKKPMILCRTNKQVKAIEELGYYDVSTVHQAKGLEYDNVIVIDETIKSLEDLNVAYVAITRARDNLFVANFAQLFRLIQRSVF